MPMYVYHMLNYFDNMDSNEDIDGWSWVVPGYTVKQVVH